MADQVETVESVLDSRLTWAQGRTPEKIERDVRGLRFRPRTKLDMWKNTYYEPVIDKFDAERFGLEISGDKHAFSMRTSLELHAVSQFDQAGLCVCANENTWLKAGIEFLDSHPTISCVVTNNGFSDWSTQPLSNVSSPHGVIPLSLRVQKKGRSFIVEVEEMDGMWRFIRIAHLGYFQHQNLFCGLFACCPTQAGASVNFSSFTILPALDLHHSAE